MKKRRILSLLAAAVILSSTSAYALDDATDAVPDVATSTQNTVTSVEPADENKNDMSPEILI